MAFDRLSRIDFSRRPEAPEAPAPERAISIPERMPVQAAKGRDGGQRQRPLRHGAPAPRHGIAVPEAPGDQGLERER